jgi:hypothetical protein
MLKCFKQFENDYVILTGARLSKTSYFEHSMVLFPLSTDCLTNNQEPSVMLLFGYGTINADNGRSPPHYPGK